MKTVTFEGTTTNWDNKVIDPAVPYSGQFTAYETIEEVRAANDYPSDKEVIKFRNDQRKANERQKTINTFMANAGYEKSTLENDPQMRLKQLYKVFIADKKSHDEARALAAQILNLKWDDDE